MTSYYGPGVSRICLTDDTQYSLALWQQGKPPTDAALNLMQDLAMGGVTSAVLSGMPSGWLSNDVNSKAAYITDPSFSNYFKFGPQRTGEQKAIMWANVNGWLLPVTATLTGTPPGSPNDVDTTNLITLDPPPSSSGDFRIDFAFLEVWKARIQPNPSTTNKPSASAIYRHGNKNSGRSYVADDLLDPTLGFETEERIQIQYQIRVVSGLIGLASNPDGFDPVVVKAQGAASSPTSFTFTNMRQVLGDPGLWRAGDGTQNALGTVDGYSYAIPICVIFRRNSVVWNNTNLNGGFNRNPTAVDRTGFKTFSGVAILASDITASATSATLVTTTNIPVPASGGLIQIGDELITYASLTGVTLNTLGRGSNGTIGEVHKTGSVVRILSGRPDGLFSDQIAFTDVLDLRHTVNTSGHDYTALLKSNLDKLLRGQLRANWKRTGGGPQGSFVFYQDAIQAAAVPLGVTQLDAPDNIRMIFSDAATIQPIECIVKPNSGSVSGPPGVDINVGWSLSLQVQAITQAEGDKFQTGDVISIPIINLKTGLQAGSTDQIRWLNDSVANAVTLRLDGETADLPSSMYTVTPAVPGFNDDLTITLGATFPTQTSTSTTPTILHIKVHAVYGPGRGLSRKPDSIHSVSYLSPSTDLLVQQSGIPSNNLGSRVSWAPLWSKYRSSTFNNMLPVTSEILADLGSKTVIVNPFRRVIFPDDVGNSVGPLTIDGNAANPKPDVKGSTPSTGTVNSPDMFTVASVGSTVPGDALVIASGPGVGRYTVTGTPIATTITVDRPIKAQHGTSVSFTIHEAQGVMPLLKVDASTSKWSTTDPLGLFCSTTDVTAAHKNIYVSLPRHLIPGWGELYTPILANDISAFSRGINFFTNSKSGSSYTDADINYVNYSGTMTHARFSTVNLNTLNPIVYNTKDTYAPDGQLYAGIRLFTDSRGLNREGLELPPFYGPARIFAVYEAEDFTDNGSAFDPITRAYVGGGATNLLRQNLPQSEGPVLWIEIDDDKDSTFILNANALDLSKSPNPITSFASGKYVIEASIFGFDRGTFDLDSEARIVLTRPGTHSWTNVGGIPVDSVTRANNINRFVAGPLGVLPGPAEGSDQMVINYSRTPYQGDAWGSTNTYLDVPYAYGPMTSGNAYQIVSTRLDQDNLTRPNQKVLEVLASTSFSTTLGTGRYSADSTTDKLIFRDVAYEDPTVYPPTSAISDRPYSLPGNYASNDGADIGTDYLGAITQLPLGSLFRDKDFRGQRFNATVAAPLIYSDVVGNGGPSSLATDSVLEQEEITLSTASTGTCSPGDILVHVDGEQGNYSLLTNYRTKRGGSVFMASGPYPGGSVCLQNLDTVIASNHVNILHGRAMLVRNTVTTVGASEVSAGNELMMLIVTNVQRPASLQTPSVIKINTNGENEGWSAADLYRIEGHPLIKNNVRAVIDPSTITLAKRSTT